MFTSIATALVVCLAAPAVSEPVRAGDDGVSLGIGWLVSQAGTPAGEPAADAEAPAASAEPAVAPAVQPKAPPPKVRPFARRSDLDDRIREARRARGMAIGFAGAVMGATAIYGVMRAVEAQHEMEAVRNEPRRTQYNPMHPR